jgi:hypothetical protein
LRADDTFFSSDPSDSAKMAGLGGSGHLKKRIYDRYKIIGFISSGTYGRVYKAQGRNAQIAEFAIKKYASAEVMSILTQG